jgi:SH3-like domain-containing protein
VTGLPLPRFASFRSEEVNMRSGPGTRYPIQWVYKRRDLPVEIEREFDVWRLVETNDGTKGWVHQATLIGNRTFVTLAAVNAPPGASPDAALATVQTVRATAAPDGIPVAYLKPGVIGQILTCDAGSDWCRVSVHSISGYLPRSAIWGLLPAEAVTGH